MALREGAATLIAPVTPAVAFAFLADPRNAPEWFAPVTFAGEPTDTAPRRTPSTSSAEVLRVGATWRFIPTASARQARGPSRQVAATPLRMAAYEPPTRFAWETTYPRTRDNLRWEITCAPVIPEADGMAHGNPTPHTTIHMTLRIEPGPLGWVSLLVAAPFTRGGLGRRAQRALERARETLAARAELAAQPRPQRPRPPHGDSKRKQRR